MTWEEMGTVGLTVGLLTCTSVVAWFALQEGIARKARRMSKRIAQVRELELSLDNLQSTLSKHRHSSAEAIKAYKRVKDAREALYNG